jgi:acetyltransferase-like isoleucine patch superfamily enzyme
MENKKLSKDQEKLYRDLKKLFHTLREEMKKEHNRSTQITDLISDRWERAKFLGFGDQTSIYDESLVIGDVVVGAGCWIGPYTILDGSGGLEISDNVTVSSGAHIYTHDNIKKTLTSGLLDISYKSVKIMNNVYIGANSIINKGVTIGQFSVVAANSFVNRDVLAHSIVGGTPAREIGRVVIDEGSVPLDYSKQIN